MKHSFLTIFILTFYMSATVHSKAIYYNNTETISYEVVEELSDNIEIRHYPSALAVESVGTKSRGAFALLFEYISGANATQKNIEMTSPVEEAKDSIKIAMTAPVETSQRTGMRFFLPSQFNKTNVPQPIHPNVRIVEVPARTLAVIRYSGNATYTRRMKYKDLLVTMLTEQGYSYTEQISYMGYDSPWTAPWKKRNEVLIQLSDSKVK